MESKQETYVTPSKFSDKNDQKADFQTIKLSYDNDCETELIQSKVNAAEPSAKRDDKQDEKDQLIKFLQEELDKYRDQIINF